MYYRDKNGGIKKNVSAILIFVLVAILIVGTIFVRKYVAINSIIKEADQLANEQNYEEAINKIEAALIKYAGSKSLIVAKKEYENELILKVKEETLEKAAAYADQQDYEMAMSVIKAAQDTYGNDSDYQALYFEYYKADVLSKVDIFVMNEDYVKAVQLLQEAYEKSEEDLDLCAELNKCNEIYIKAVLNNVEVLVNEYRINDAIEEVKQALDILKDNDELNKKLKELNDYKPVAITDLTSLNASKWKWNDGTAKDPFGKDYSSACNYAIFHNQSSQERKIEYRVEGKYNKLTGLLAPHADIGEKITCTVLVYADDSLIYTSPIIEQKTDAIIFEVDIEDAEYIKLEVRFNDTNPWDVFVNRLIISDVQLWPIVSSK